MALNLTSERTVNAGIQETNPDNLREYMDALKEDVIAATIAAAVPAIHHVSNDLAAAIPAAPVSLAESYTFLNAATHGMKEIIEAHFNGAHPTGNHFVASAETIAAADANSQGTADTLAAEIVADYNTHRTEANVHLNNDAVNVMVDSTDGGEPNLLVTCGSIRTQFLAHMADALAMNAGSVE